MFSRWVPSQTETYGKVPLFSLFLISEPSRLKGIRFWCEGPGGRREPHADRTAGMTVARSALSSRSLHERDDGAERIILVRGGVRVRTMPVEQLAEVRQLAAE